MPLTKEQIFDKAPSLLSANSACACSRACLRSRPNTHHCHSEFDPRIVHIIKTSLLTLTLTHYIDDLWNPLVDKTNFQEMAEQIYPPESGLVLGDPEHVGHSVNYLDMAIWFDNKSQQWHSKLYDKKLELVAIGLKLNKFPDPTSKLSTRCKYGVITNQLHRYNVACTHKREFLIPAHSLYKTYIQKGYSQKKVKSINASLVLRRHVPHYLPGQVLRQWRHKPSTLC